MLRSSSRPSGNTGVAAARLAVCLAGLIAAATAPVAPVAPAAPVAPVAPAAPVAAQLGSIRGRLDIRRPARPVERRPGVAEPGAAGVRDYPDLGRGVVYLAASPSGAAAATRRERAVMDQRQETFVPHVLAIMTGAVVEFPNSDEIFHNVFSLSKTRRFDLGRYAAGRSKSVRFDKPGVVRVFCDIHSHMNAFILVFDHPYFAVTDPDGSFHLDDVPPGTHTVVGWYEGEARTSRAVTVPAGTVVNVELIVR